uniref:Uncharacterized protein n=1 Tax=Romanomermis culicivorax TaxID=13658 RepID=A0A915IS23_ROMCU
MQSIPAGAINNVCLVTYNTPKLLGGTAVSISNSTYESMLSSFYQSMSDDSNDQILCRKDVNGLELIPNIFYCNSTQYCCNQDGAYACCSKEISPQDVYHRLSPMADFVVIPSATVPDFTNTETKKS